VLYDVAGDLRSKFSDSPAHFAESFAKGVENLGRTLGREVNELVVTGPKGHHNVRDGGQREQG
jgi:hypothetical protein